MKIIIAGSREGFTIGEVYEAFLAAVERIGIKGVSEVVSGTAKGVDKYGEAIALWHDIPIKRFPEDWDTHGKKAGYLRSEEMAKYADALIAMSYNDSKGTQHMINLAKKHGLKVFVRRKYES